MIAKMRLKIAKMMPKIAQMRLKMANSTHVYRYMFVHLSLYIYVWSIVFSSFVDCFCYVIFGRFWHINMTKMRLKMAKMRPKMAKMRPKMAQMRLKMA